MSLFHVLSASAKYPVVVLVEPGGVHSKRWWSEIIHCWELAHAATTRKTLLHRDCQYLIYLNPAQFGDVKHIHAENVN
jgi:hypothetical protein